MPTNLLSFAADKPSSPGHRTGNNPSTKYATKPSTQIQNSVQNCESSKKLNKEVFAKTCAPNSVSQAIATEHTVQNLTANSAPQAPGQKCVQEYVSSSTSTAFHTAKMEDQSGASNSSCDASFQDVASSTQHSYRSNSLLLKHVSTTKSASVLENLSAAYSTCDTSLQNIAASTKNSSRSPIPALEPVSTVEGAPKSTSVLENLPANHMAKHSSFDASLEENAAPTKDPQVENILAVKSARNLISAEKEFSSENSNASPTSPLENVLNAEPAPKSITRYDKNLDLAIESQPKQKRTRPVKTVTSVIRRHISHGHGPAKRHTTDKSAKPAASQTPIKKRPRRSNSTPIPGKKTSSFSIKSSIAVPKASLCIDSKVYICTCIAQMHICIHNRTYQVHYWNEGLKPTVHPF